MLLCLVFLGAGAITYFIAEGGYHPGNKKPGLRAFIEWFMYAVLDNFVALLILLPMDKAAIVTTSDGMQTIRFFILGYGVFLFVAVVLGFAAAVAKKKFRIDIEIEQGKGVGSDEEKK